MLATQRHDLHRWLAPEILFSRGMANPQKSSTQEGAGELKNSNAGRQHNSAHVLSVAEPVTDLYSLCSIVAELFTSEEPWHDLDNPNAICNALRAGHSLAERLVIPPPRALMPQALVPHLQAGLKLAKVDRRKTNLHQLRGTLLQLVKNTRVHFDNPDGTANTDLLTHRYDSNYQELEPVARNSRGGPASNGPTHLPVQQRQFTSELSACAGAASRAGAATAMTTRVASRAATLAASGAASRAAAGATSPAGSPAGAYSASGARARFATTNDSHFCNQLLSEDFSFPLFPMEPVTPQMDLTTSGNESALFYENLSPEERSYIERPAPNPQSYQPGAALQSFSQRAPGNLATGDGPSVADVLFRDKTRLLTIPMPSLSSASIKKEPILFPPPLQVQDATSIQKLGSASFCVFPKTISAATQIGDSLLDMTQSDSPTFSNRSFAVTPDHYNDPFRNSSHIPNNPRSEFENPNSHQFGPETVSTLRQILPPPAQAMPHHNSKTIALKPAAQVISYLHNNPYPPTFTVGSNGTTRVIRSSDIQHDCHIGRRTAAEMDDPRHEIRCNELHSTELRQQQQRHQQQRRLRFSSSSSIEARRRPAHPDFPFADVVDFGASNTVRQRSISLTRPSPSEHDSFTIFGMKPATHFTDRERLPHTGLSPSATCMQHGSFNPQNTSFLVFYL